MKFLDPRIMLYYLSHVILSVRAFASILLRRLLTNSWEVFAAMSSETQNTFKIKLLEVSYFMKLLIL